MITGTNYIGKQFGNYRLEKYLGSGSFGNVYLGQHIHLASRTCAIKIMHSTHLDSSQEQASFLQEARMLEMLKHPNILPVFDVGIHDGFPYLAAEYASGGSLRDRLQRQGMVPIDQAIKILSQIGQALHFAHQRQIIHRDLKPGNILFNANGDALLGDFGIAVTLATASIKFVAEASGSPPYMAPEQFQGTISKKTDQYSLGCIAYELFTGHRPFSAPDPITMGFKHLTETPIPPGQLNPNLPAPIEQAVLKAMAKRPEDRHDDLLAFITALQASPVSQGSTPAHLNEAAKQVGEDDEDTQRNIPLLSTRDALTAISEDNLPTLRSPQWPPVTVSAEYTVPSSPLSPVARSTAPNPVTPPSAVNVDYTIPAEPDPQMRNLAAQFAPVSNPVTPLPPINNNVTLPANTAPPPPFIGGGPKTFPPPGNQLPPKQGKTGRKSNPRRRGLLIAAILVLVLLLLSGGSYEAYSYYVGTHPVSASVELTPKSSTMQNNFTLSIVTGTPNPNQNQVAGARFLTASKSLTRQTSATGVAYTSAKNATGYLVFVNNSTLYNWTFYAGEYVTSSSGITIILDETKQIVTSGTIASHAYQQGTKGNIPAYDVNTTCCPDNSGGPNQVQIYNSQAVSGGTDPAPYSVVQQSDIDNASQALNNQLTPQVQAAIQQQIRTGEQFVAPIQCSPSTSADKKVGDATKAFNVTVTVKCFGEVYETTEAQQMGANLLTQQASSSLGASYALAGSILTSTNTPLLVDAKHGTLSIVVSTQGIWVYQLSNDEKHTFAQAIAGKTPHDAQVLLLTMPGVDKAIVTLSGGGFQAPTDIPIDLARISFTVAKVPGLQVSPTPNPTSTGTATH